MPLQTVNQVEIRLMEGSSDEEGSRGWKARKCVCNVNLVVVSDAPVALPARAQEAESNPQVVNEDYHDTSIPVREMASGGAVS